MDSQQYNDEQKQILDQVKKRLNELFPSQICKFGKLCKGYNEEFYACQHEIEACKFCGLYKQHAAAVIQMEMKRMLSGTDFADFAE